jgi:hypothetical protein
MRSTPKRKATTISQLETAVDGELTVDALEMIAHRTGHQEELFSPLAL